MTSRHCRAIAAQGWKPEFSPWKVEGEPGPQVGSVLHMHMACTLTDTAMHTQNSGG